MAPASTPALPAVLRSWASLALVAIAVLGWRFLPFPGATRLALAAITMSWRTGSWLHGDRRWLALFAVVPALVAAAQTLAQDYPAIWPCDVACSGGGRYAHIGHVSLPLLATLAWSMLVLGGGGHALAATAAGAPALGPHAALPRAAGVDPARRRPVPHFRRLAPAHALPRLRRLPHRGPGCRWPPARRPPAHRAAHPRAGAGVPGAGGDLRCGAPARRCRTEAHAAGAATGAAAALGQTRGCRALLGQRLRSPDPGARARSALPGLRPGGDRLAGGAARAAGDGVGAARGPPAQASVRADRDHPGRLVPCRGRRGAGLPPRSGPCWATAPTPAWRSCCMVQPATCWT